MPKMQHRSFRQAVFLIVDKLLNSWVRHDRLCKAAIDVASEYLKHFFAQPSASRTGV